MKNPQLTGYGLVTFMLFWMVTFINPVSAETRDLAAFTKVEIGGAYKVILVQDNNHKVVLEGDSGAVSNTLTKVEGSTLKIFQKAKNTGKGEVVLVISFSQLSELDCSGAVMVSSKGQLKGKSIEMEFSGAGKADLDIAAENVNIEISGTASVTLKGSATSSTIEISGTGKLTAGDFMVDKCNIEISGVGNASVYVKSDLDVEISGTGNVSYKGEPHIKKEISGMGNLKKL